MNKDDKMFIICLLIKWFFIISCISIIMVACSHINRARGEKIGKVTKVAQEGLICRTYEAEVIRGGFTDGSGAFGVLPFHFTIPNEKMMLIVKYAMENQKSILVKYHRRLFAPCDSGNMGNYFADEIIIREDSNERKIS